MELPDDVIALIRDYSLPITRPNWRQSKPILSTYQLYLVAKKKIDESILRTRYNTHYNKHYEALLTNIKGTDWYYSYRIIKNFGLNVYYHRYFTQYGVVTNLYRVKQIDGLYEAYLKYNLLYSIYPVYMSNLN